MFKPSNILFGLSVFALIVMTMYVFTLLYPANPLSSLLFWQDSLSGEVLDQSLTLGTRFLLNNQKREGNFNYEYDWVSGVMNQDDNQVRQAGALWGIALIQQAAPSRQLEQSLQRGLKFFRKNSLQSADGRRWVVYPTEKMGKTGTIALVSLAIIDFLRSESEVDQASLDALQWELGQYLDFLLSLRRDDGLFYGYYDIQTGSGFGKPSPYSDGEALLAMVKASRYLGFAGLHDPIMHSGSRMSQAYVRDALKQDPDSKVTKGFYQWGSMSFFELATSGWSGTDHYGQIVIDLADWMIDVHHTLRRTRNTAYAYEGIIHAYQLARLQSDQEHLEKFAAVIDRGLYKLTTWQVGSSIRNRFLRKHHTTDKRAVGGIMNHRKESKLRIDVTQHQMHAVILAR